MHKCIGTYVFVAIHDYFVLVVAGYCYLLKSIAIVRCLLLFGVSYYFLICCYVSRLVPISY